MIFAIWDGNLDCVKYLVEHGADTEARTRADGRTSLIWASYWGHLELVEYFVSHGANLEAEDLDGYTSLMRSCEEG